VPEDPEDWGDTIFLNLVKYQPTRRNMPDNLK